MDYDWQQVDWKDKRANIADNFNVHEALFLPSWRVYHVPSNEERQEIVKTAAVMQKIRELFDNPVVVHCWMRPTKANVPRTDFHGKNYNRFIGSKSTKSAHIFGRAVDFHVSGLAGPEGCAEARAKILPLLEEWNIRMENIKGGWIHIDTNPVNNKRFFRP